MFADCLFRGVVLDMIYILLSTEGRIGRHQFWMGALALLAASLLIYFFALFLVSMKVTSLALIASCMVMFIYSIYCLFVKRLHDRGRNGRLFILYLALHCILAFVVPTEISDPNGIVAHGSDLLFWVVQFGKLAVLFLGLYFFVICGFLKGIDGPNQYGRDPLA